MLDFSNCGLAVLKTLEGLRLEPYECAAGVLTIGYGHVIRPGDKHKISKIEAAVMLKEDVLRFARAVWANCEEGGRIPTQSQFDAMVSLAFNIGEDGFLRSSVLRRFINHDDAGAASAFLLWNKVRKRNPKTGRRELRPSRTLEARRTAESRMFLLGYYDKTPYDPLDDNGEIAELKISRNRSNGDDNIGAGESEIRPNLKSSRTIKQTTVGSVSAGVTGTAATAAGVKAVADQVAESSEAVKTAVEVTGEAATAAGETINAVSALPVVLSAVMAVGSFIAIISFVLVRRARKDDWRRGRR